MKHPMLRKAFAMPFAFALASICSILPVSPIALAAAVTGDPLNIGANNSISGGSASAVIGDTNQLIDASGSTVIGSANSLSSSSYILMVGDQNMSNLAMSGAAIGEMNYLYDYFNVAFGAYNSVAGWVNSAFGDSNHISNDDANVTAESSVFTGMYNHGNNLIACLVGGSNNQLDYATNSAAIGEGLILGPGTQAQVVVGQYNAPDANARFVVATGTDAYNPKNAFTVFANGDVIIKKRQGDILMGEFGN